MEGEGVCRLATVCRRYVPDSGVKPRGRGSSRKRRSNGEEARSAEMRNGCSMVDFFGGCEGRSEDGCD